MQPSSRATDIVALDFVRPEGWYELPRPGENPPDWAEELVASVEAGDASAALADQLREVRRVTEAEDPSGTTTTWVYLPLPAFGSVSAVMTWGVIWLEAGDDPESWLAGAEEHADDRAADYEIRGFTSWRRAHPMGEARGFAHLVVTESDEGTESLIEERVVFGVFPPGSGQMVQAVFRSAFLGAFEDMVAETGEIVETMHVELGEL